jgi:hypothetical protein
VTQEALLVATQVQPDPVDTEIGVPAPAPDPTETVVGITE